MRPAHTRTSVIIVVVAVLAGSLLWASPAQAETTVLLAEVPADSEGTPTDPEECGALDYGCRVTVGVYLWIAGLVGDLVEFTITLIALPALATPPPADGLRTVWGEVLTITNSLYVLVVIVAGVLLMGYQTVQTSTALKDLLPRVFLGFIAANASWLLIEMMRELANGIAISMLDGAATLDNVTATITRVFDNPLGEALVVLLLMLVGALLSTFWMLAVIIRVVLWIVLTAISPIALACHALPQTEGLARLWWRSMAALMIIQVAQGLVLRLVVVLFLSRNAAPTFIEGAQNVIDVLLIICLMYVLIRIPFWAFKHAFNYQNSPLVKGAKVAVSLLVFRSLGRAFAATKGTAAPRSPRGGRPPPPSNQRPRPDPGTGGQGPASPPPRPSPGGPGRSPRPGASTGPGRNSRGGSGRNVGPGRGPRGPGGGPGRNPRGRPGRGTGPGPGPTPPPRSGPPSRSGPPTRPGSPRNPRSRRRP